LHKAEHDNKGRNRETKWVGEERKSKKGERKELENRGQNKRGKRRCEEFETMKSRSFLLRMGAEEGGSPGVERAESRWGGEERKKKN